MMLASLSAQFGWVDWSIVIGYLVFTTWLGARMAGRQATFRDFFLGGRKLPWYAVSGSIIATEISALTFVSVPWVVFQPGGNFAYLQLGVFGSFFARVLVGYILVPVYYQREIYSPYDYMQNQLGGRVRDMTTALFVLSGMLAQSARIYLTAEVLNVVMHDQLAWLSNSLGMNPLAWAIIVIGLISVGWTLIGGIATVIWTDVVLFLAFLVGAIVAICVVAYSLDGGWSELFKAAWGAKESGVHWAPWGAPKTSGPWGKFTFFDWSTDPARAYTIWTAVIASTWGGMGAYGTDQLLAQRMFCCKGPRQARWAIISSTLSQIVTFAVMLVGAGLYVYYTKHEPSPEGQALVADITKGDRIFPIFTIEVVPTGWAGVIIAAIFAAAISSVMGILTALSQTVQTAFYNPLRERYLRRRGVHVKLSGDLDGLSGHATSTEERRSVLVGRLFVMFWGVVLCLLAYFASVVREFYPSILDLGLSMSGYCLGALLAGFALSFLPLKVDGRGFMYSGPLSVLCVFAVVWHQPWTHYVCWAFAIGLLLVWVWSLMSEAMTTVELTDASERNRRALSLVLRDWPQTAILVAGLALMLWLSYRGYWEGPLGSDGAPTLRTIAWPWQIPLGSTVAFVWGYLLARRRSDADTKLSAES
jgi:Na+/proline symporter